MYNEKIEELINTALVDGVLTEKEKQVLFKKAQAEGIDLDEFEMVLDARLFELRKAAEAKLQKAAPNSNKLGDVRKCPNCGAVMGAFQMICPECGFEFSGVGPNKFVEEFSKKLQEKIEEYKRYGDGDFNILQELFENLGYGVIKKQRQKNDIATIEADFVKNYPLPMTKEDCVEMLNFILPKVHISGLTSATWAWRSKFYSILSKLENENKNNPQIIELVSSYRDQAKMFFLGKFIVWAKSLPFFVRVIFWIASFYVIFFVGFQALINYLIHL